MAAAKVVVANTAFAAEIGGQELLVREGERFTSTHPVVKAHPKWFEPDDADVARAPR
jgi:hypothetical protein